MKRICAAPGCDEYAKDGAARCEEHLAEAANARRAAGVAAKARAEAAAANALYGTARWKSARLQFLRDNPLCVHCLEVGLLETATDVDHIEPHKGDRVKFFDRENWQALCHSCHSRKTAREVFAGRRR